MKSVPKQLKKDLKVKTHPEAYQQKVIAQFSKNSNNTVKNVAPGSVPAQVPDVLIQEKLNSTVSI